MPTRPKTSDDAIVTAARAILERDGSEAFSLSDVAARVGVKPPSLQKRIVDRASLLTALERRGFEELGAVLRDAATRDEPLTAMARAYRNFALTSPALYARMLSPEASRSDESQQWREQAVAPVFHALKEHIGASQALAAARTLTAFLHGFVALETTGAFRLGGDVPADFETALAAVLRGVRTLA